MNDVPFEAVLSSMTEGVMVVDHRSVVRFVNPAAQRLLHVTMPAPAGHPLLEVIRHTELQDVLQQVIVSGHTVTRELTCFSPDERLCRVQAVVYQRHTGQRGVVAVLSDITEIRRLERLRRDFVANVSHELRTPVTAIRAAIETLEHGAADEAPAREQFLNKISCQTERLARLIDELVALAQIESHAVDVRSEAVHIAPLVQEVVAALELHARARHITMTANIPSNLPAVDADRERLYQVLVNLLENAIKFNHDHGTVTVRGRHERSMVYVLITDTGMGIPATDLEHIFERFYRVEKGRAREYGGTGLGLAIAKHLIEAQGGQISVESHLDRGSTFTLQLPTYAVVPHSPYTHVTSA